MEARWNHSPFFVCHISKYKGRDVKYLHCILVLRYTLFAKCYSLETSSKRTSKTGSFKHSPMIHRSHFLFPDIGMTFIFVDFVEE